MKNTLQYLEETVKKYGNKTAIIEEEKKCSYKELQTRSKQIGTCLSNYIKLKEPVLVLMEKGINAIYSFFGTVYAGGFYILLNTELPNERLKQIIDVANANAIITDEEHYDLAKELTNKTIIKIEETTNIDIDDQKLNHIRSKALDVDPLYANFTSGSTGTPKGVLICHRSVIDFINIFTEKFDINNNDIIANQAPFDFDVSVKDIYSSIFTGATLLIIPRKYFSKPADLLDYITNNNATTMIWAVSALCLITTFHGLDYKVPTTVNKILFSGEVMPLKHLKQWVEKLPDALFVNLYGPTEITCNCTYHVIDKSLEYEKQIPIGKTFDNEEVFLLDENNMLITEKEKIGEICVKGTAIGLGYYNNSEQTNKNFVQNPLNNSYIDMIYKTGDLAFIGEDDNFYFSGRKDFQIKHMGHRIELEEIELAINKHKEIERVCCLYDEEKSKLYAFYIGSIDKNNLKKELSAQLPIFMVPNVLRQIENMPITKNGKIDRKLLLKNEKEKKYIRREN